MINEEQIAEMVKDAVLTAGSTFRQDKKDAYRNAIAKETNHRAKWILEQILQNALAAEKNKSPLCDDTGIPHLILEIGPNVAVTGHMLDAIEKGVAKGLRMLPGRPMGIMGDDNKRLNQSGGLDPDPAGVKIAPILLKKTDTNKIRLILMMFGGGPAIRAKTYRIFHKHDTNVVLDEIVVWAKEAVSMLGCSPCTLAVGIGRSHFEASALMMEAIAEGNYFVQSELEKQITARMNAAGIGPLGLHGDMSVLATFLKVGPQRASGVRIVCIRPCCCFEPRIAAIDLTNRME